MVGFSLIVIAVLAFGSIVLVVLAVLGCDLSSLLSVRSAVDPCLSLTLPVQQERPKNKLPFYIIFFYWLAMDKFQTPVASAFVTTWLHKKY